MEFILNPFSLTLIISGLLVGALSVYISVKVEGSTRLIALTMLCASIWGFFYGLELSVSTREAILIFIKLEYVGISFLGAFWLIFSLIYTSFRPKYYGIILALVLVIPILTYILVLTNDSHQLFYKSISIIESGALSIANIEIGPWYIVNLIYTYTLYLLGYLIIWWRFRFSDQLFKTQTRLMLLAGVFPMIFNLLYQFEIIIPLQVIDLTPFSFLFTYLILGFAILKYQLFNIKPIAHNKVIEAITKGVLLVDAQDRIVDFNPAFLAFGISTEKVKISIEVQDIFQNQRDILALITTGVANRIESKITSDGNRRFFQIETIPLLNRKSNKNGLIVLFEDITEQKSINQTLKNQKLELQQLNDLKDKYFSIISHDLKGPIFGIKELIHLTNSGMVAQDEFMSMLPEVSRNMEQVALLLENLLAWSSSQLKGGERVKPQEFDIHKILEQQKSILERIANEKQLEIEIKPQAKSLISADKNMIELAVRNIISNSIKFSKKGGEIKISTHDELQFVIICIEDYGKGISKENLLKINEGISFTTVGENNESGTGLGLVLVKEYIQKNNGSIEVFSQEGKGTKFCIYLPISTQE
ncbi:sensor histidine kinase [Algoriphagus yeomjeoni]|uniref:histidine kinase n=1 Tax=Algoriphagus yeomjeoni TaxID=291403 RepID=A0A327P6R8_9BACT|nr:histidine kinase N-terminal 7TM domain-containing protein [Algoriphagus yeomjeoni]RAI87949.1 PAS domain S-box-containing protein [Algoriphagus yeomjeoni]